jgi:hypothetical protein
VRDHNGSSQTRVGHVQSWLMAEDKPPATLPDVLTRAQNRTKAAYPWRGAKPFQPGQSGNPGGQSRFYFDCRRIARDASPEMMRGLIELAKNAEGERVRSVCIIAVLDRAGVRPIDFDPKEQFSHYDHMSLED